MAIKANIGKIWHLGNHGKAHDWLRRAHKFGIMTSIAAGPIHHYEIPVSNIDPATVLAFCLLVLPLATVANLVVFLSERGGGNRKRFESEGRGQPAGINDEFGEIVGKLEKLRSALEPPLDFQSKDKLAKWIRDMGGEISVLRGRAWKVMGEKPKHDQEFVKQKMLELNEEYERLCEKFGVKLRKYEVEESWQIDEERMMELEASVTFLVDYESILSNPAHPKRAELIDKLELLINFRILSFMHGVYSRQIKDHGANWARQNLPKLKQLIKTMLTKGRYDRESERAANKAAVILREVIDNFNLEEMEDAILDELQAINRNKRNIPDAFFREMKDMLGQLICKLRYELTKESYGKRMAYANKLQIAYDLLCQEEAFLVGSEIWSIKKSMEEGQDS